MSEMIQEDTCKLHSGICADMENLKESDRNQWNAINAMRTRSTATLTAVLVTMVGMLVNLLILLVKSGVTHP